MTDPLRGNEIQAGDGHGPDYVGLTIEELIATLKVERETAERDRDKAEEQVRILLTKNAKLLELRQQILNWCANYDGEGSSYTLRPKTLSDCWGVMHALVHRAEGCR